ncbi:MAG: type II secretion system protein GspM [Burkholderiaceae bacterium]
MKLNSPALNRYSQPLQDFWSVRNPRERNMLSIAATAIALALVYLLLIDPALEGRDQLRKTLPNLRQQVAQMQALSKEAGELADRDAPVVEPISRTSVEASLSRNGLKPQNLTVNNEVVIAQFSGASFAQLVRWLQDMQKTAMVTVVESNIVAQDQPDTVNATLTLRQQRNE